jgi:hypothetical protein
MYRFILSYKAYILGRIFSTDVEIEDDEVSSNADMVLFSDGTIIFQ